MMKTLGELQTASQKKVDRRRDRTHKLVADSAGFRVNDEPSLTYRDDIKEDLKWLEHRGLVTFVSGVGWVDTAPAIERYKKFGDAAAADDLSRRSDPNFTPPGSCGS